MGNFLSLLYKVYFVLKIVDEEPPPVIKVANVGKPETDGMKLRKEGNA